VGVAEEPMCVLPKFFHRGLEALLLQVLLLQFGLLQSPAPAGCLIW
jgi:hypothetical protein